MADNKLTDLKVRNAKQPGLYGDGQGLWLQVSDSTAALPRAGFTDS